MSQPVSFFITQIARCALASALVFSPLLLSATEIVTYKIPTAEPAKTPNYGVTHALLAAASDGTSVLSHTTKQGHSYLIWLNKDNQPTHHVKINDHIIYAIYAHDDGSAAVIAGKEENNTYTRGWPNVAYLIRIQNNGKQKFATRIVGQSSGLGGGKSQFRGEGSIAFNGDEYALYFGIMHNFAKRGKDTHQGDFYIEVDKNGKIKPNTREAFVNSHAAGHHVLESGDRFYSYVVNDAPSNGDFRVRGPRRRSNVFPGGAWKRDRSRGLAWAAYPQAFFEFKGKLFVFQSAMPNGPIYNSNNDSKLLPMMLRINKDGTTEKDVFLDRGGRARYVSAAPFGSHILFAWHQGEFVNYRFTPQTAKLGLVDRDGKIVLAPRNTPAPIGFRSNFVSYPDGSVGFTQVKPGTSTIHLTRLKSMSASKLKSASHRSVDTQPATKSAQAQIRETYSFTDLRDPGAGKKYLCHDTREADSCTYWYSNRSCCEDTGGDSCKSGRVTTRTNDGRFSRGALSIPGTCDLRD